MQHREALLGQGPEKPTNRAETGVNPWHALS